MSQNVLIPLFLLEQIIEFMQELDLSEYHPLNYAYGNILWALTVKKQKLELRDAYAKIIQADNRDDRDDARIRYLQKRMSLERDIEDDIIF
jgi:hypothetical protein